MTLAGGGLCSPPSSLSPHPNISYCYSVQVSFSFWECHSLHKHFSFYLLSWIGNKTMSSGKKWQRISKTMLFILAQDGENVMLITCWWASFCGHLLHVLTMSHRCWISLWKWTTCGHHYAAITASTFQKILIIWLLKCAPTQCGSSGKVGHWWWEIKPGSLGVPPQMSDEVEGSLLCGSDKCFYTKPQKPFYS